MRAEYLESPQYDGYFQEICQGPFILTIYVNVSIREQTDQPP